MTNRDYIEHDRIFQKYLDFEKQHIYLEHELNTRIEMRKWISGDTEVVNQKINAVLTKIKLLGVEFDKWLDEEKI